MKSINPATEKLIHEYNEHTENECDEILDRVYNAWDFWKKTSFTERSVKMNGAAKVLRRHKNEYARLITDEMGKLFKEAVSEIEKSAWVCEYYAEKAEEFLSDEHIKSDGTESFVSFEPLGPVLAVMPWNFPFWQVFRFAAPALMAGNAAVLKHASNVPGCALAIESIFREARFPENLFRTLLISSGKVNHVIGNEKIIAATLTGSEYAGSKVAEEAGKMLKKTVMELGGSDPYIVFADADLDKCVETAVNARMINTGQSCIAAKRFIVVEEIAGAFTEKVMAKMKQLKGGNPVDGTSDFGPMARPDLRDDLDEQVQKSVKMGAELLLGGRPIDRKGYFYEPTVITNVSPDMPVFNEETFGPVLSIIRVENELEAIDMANNSQYGLGGSIWTKDIQKGIKAARQVESGAVFVNGMTKSDPRLPFGGIKNSGYGRELSHYGIREFVNIKTIWVA